MNLGGGCVGGLSVIICCWVQKAQTLETAVNYRIKYLFVLFGQDEDSWITATPVQLTITAQRAL